ncbi:MAG: acyl-CoA dehydrogenase family protein [Frankia sp.]|nr:acyl-CoA dehydrogenase family protein [Frankia sp.]
MSHAGHEGPGLGRAAEAFRAEVCAWLTEVMAPERTAGNDNPRDRTGLAEAFERALQRAAGRRGYLGISLPAEAGGGGRPAVFAAAFGYEVAYHDAPLVDTAVTLAAGPVLAFGTPEQRARLLPRMLGGEIEMCIAYTEPGAGNDLSALAATATPLPGGGFRLRGHKTLVTGADKADLCLTVARTDPAAPARRGTSMFVVDMRRPGVRVVPRRTMAGYDLFDIHFDDVELPADALLGTPNEGWRQLAFAVEQERTGMFHLGWCQRVFDELHRYCLTPADGGSGARPVDDPLVADGLASLWAGLRDARHACVRLAEQEAAGRRSSASASVAKVTTTEYLQRLARFATEVAGPLGTIEGVLFGPADPAAPARGRFAFEYLFRFDGTVSVGTNELHRDGIAASLGLSARARPPADGDDPAPAVDVPADGEPVRAAARALLSSWDLGRLAGTTASGPGYDQSLWAALLADVWPRVATAAAVQAVAEELGLARCPLPLHTGLVQPATLLARLGAAGAGHLAALRRGDARYALCPAGARAVPGAGGGWRLTGQARFVTYADSADVLLVPAGTDDGRTLVAAVPATAAGVRVDTHATISADHLSDVALDGVSVADGQLIAGPDDGGVAPALAAAATMGLVALAAELTGLAAGMLRVTVGRVRSRVAYGQPLAAQQAVRQRAADLYLDVLAARAATTAAANELTPVAAAAAKLTAATAAQRAAAAAHQLCGGWGHLDDAGLHHYTRAAKAAEWQLGSPAEQRRTIARYLADPRRSPGGAPAG